MVLYKLGRERHKGTVLSGIGGEYASGRWHKKGERIIYTSLARSLSLLEILVHTQERAYLPDDLVFYTLEIPDDISSVRIDKKFLTKNWNNFPYESKTQMAFADFTKGNSHLLLEVPSAIIPEESNIIINPNHPDILKVKLKKVSPFNLDNRL